jgi:hypothetical protein
MLDTHHILCSNPKCKKKLDFSNKDVISLTIIFKSALAGQDFPSTGRLYCNQKCYDEVISNVNVDVPPLMQVDIVENKRLSENPIHYRVICKARSVFKVG